MTLTFSDLSTRRTLGANLDAGQVHGHFLNPKRYKSDMIEITRRKVALEMFDPPAFWWGMLTERKRLRSNPKKGEEQRRCSRECQPMLKTFFSHCLATFGISPRVLVDW